MSEQAPHVAYAFFCQYVYADPSGKVSCVGLWGPECRVLASPPAQIDLAFHASVRHGSVERLVGRLVLSSPNVPTQTIPLDLAGRAGATSNVNVNMPGFQFLDAGETVARLDFDTEPPTSCETRLAVSFQQAG